MDDNRYIDRRFRVIIKDDSEYHGCVGIITGDWFDDNGEQVGWILEVMDDDAVHKVYGSDVTFYG
ncbi:hypothetical protein NS115_03645 [Paenibacillus jamilae]|uniref:Uncharacterized protein n=1 Tax=Paenibacillus jamilae TaxID=114136 RepID=A0ACC4ZZ58_9BACL|nr:MULTISPECIES: hypothetical protein [Bacillales]KTS84437.1 hypothetical protein NS115_03645 [Paenibacillus jamilae]KTT54318.1 hypothetical protein SB7C_12345 [Staphylococcus epidermidis]